ncbi:MAG: aspartate/glutamate racemase family protein [Ectothiorhodospiraceae bacterium]|nr:aspartate/glutamate racemase family protein [Ectothiorhodospiraceae bacterium]
MRILVVNPNTTASMTEKIGVAARAAVSPGTEVVAVNPSMGPVSIEGYYDEAFALPGLLEEIARGEREGFDAHVIACFDDTGLDAARALARGPVLGICEAGLHLASMLGGRCAIVTTLSRSVPALEGLARRYGMAERTHVTAAEVPVLALEDPSSGAEAKVRETIRRAIATHGADTVLLGCAGMADLARRLADDVGLPVIDGVSAAARLAESLVALGLRTSKVGGYASPLAKPYLGMLAPFAPSGDDHKEAAR